MKITHTHYHPPTLDSEVHFTINMRAESLHYLVGTGFYSKDDKGEADEDTASNISRMWDRMGYPEPSTFTSLAARVVEASGAILGEYGPVVVQLDPQAIRDDTCIVNGDFKNLGYHLQSGGSVADVLRLSIGQPHLAQELNRLARESRKRHKRGPRRLRGSYFEARVRRAISAKDVTTIYLPEGVELPPGFVSGGE